MTVMKRASSALREAVFGAVLLHELPQIAAVELSLDAHPSDATLPTQIARRLRRAWVLAERIDSALRNRMEMPTVAKTSRRAFWTLTENWETIQRVAGVLERDPLSKITMRRDEIHAPPGARTGEAAPSTGVALTSNHQHKVPLQLDGAR
jgi:hypothetical protein